MRRPCPTGFLAGVVALGILAVAAPAAHADLFTSTFTQSNLASSSTVQDWGTLSISCNGTSCTGTLAPSSGTIFFGNEFLEFNLAGTATNLSASIGTLSAGGNVNGFGSFDNQISLSDGPSTGVSSSTQVFTVDYTGTADSLLVDNTGGWDAAGHISISGNTCTGFAAESGSGATENGSSSNCVAPPPPTDAPEPGSLALLGTALAGFGLVGWRRRAQSLR